MKKTQLTNLFQRRHPSLCIQAMSHGARKNKMWGARRKLLAIACKRDPKVAALVEKSGIRKAVKAVIRPAVVTALESINAN